jgi:hypothetical protein
MTTIGTCVSCDRTICINADSICEFCLGLGPTFVAISTKIRRDKAFAMEVYRRIRTDVRNREMFETVYGRPTGLRLVR